MSNTNTTAAPVVILTNNPPEPIGLADNYDVGVMFKRASRDDSRSSELANTAETRAAIAALVFYHKKNYDQMTVGTFWKLDARVGKNDWDKERYGIFREELRSACGMVRPQLGANGIKNDDYSREEAEYKRLDKLLGRGLELAFDMVMTPDVASRLTAEQVLTWYDDKAGLFIVPYEKLLRRGQNASGELGTKAYGVMKMVGGKLEVSKPPVENYRIPLNNGIYTAAMDGVEEPFRANTARVKLCALSYRVEVKSVTTTDEATGDTIVTETVTPIEPANARNTVGKQTAAAAGNGSSGSTVAGVGKDGAITPLGRPEGSASIPAGVSFETAMRTMLDVAREPIDRSGPDAYWSNYPYATQLDNLITALSAMKADMISFETQHKKEAERKAKDQEANRAKAAAERKAQGKADLAATSEQRKA